MALTISYKRCIYRFLRKNICTGIISLNNHNGRIMSMEEDSMEEFTTQLIQKKIEKWSTRKAICNLALDLSNEIDYKPSILNLSIDKINNLFQEAIDNNNNSNVLKLIEQCIFHKICPSESNLLYALAVCSQTGNIAMIRNIQNLYKNSCSESLLQHSNFQHYIAEATWVRGNTIEALDLFKKVYKENTYLRRRIRLMLKNLILDIITSRSEAVLVNVTKFSEDLVKEYKDFYPLTCLWQTCFLSEWYSDQCLAVELLNKHDELCESVIIRIPYVVAVSLNNHRTEVVYRLLETLLKFEMKMEYTRVLLSLLDYQIHQKNIRRCREIIRWSEQNDVELLPVHHQKYLKLLINYKDDSSLKKTKSVKLPVTKTHFKF